METWQYLIYLSGMIGSYDGVHGMLKGFYKGFSQRSSEVPFKETFHFFCSFKS